MLELHGSSEGALPNMSQQLKGGFGSGGQVAIPSKYRGENRMDKPTESSQLVYHASTSAARS